jgi:hypothetical protein
MIEVEAVERGESLRGGSDCCCETDGNNEEEGDESRFAHNFSERFRRNEEGGVTLAWEYGRRIMASVKRGCQRAGLCKGDNKTNGPQFELRAVRWTVVD